MGLSKFHYTHILIQFYLISHAICQPNFIGHFCITTYGHYTNTSTYKANLNTLFSSILSNTNNSGFYSFSFGQDPDQVTSIALCRGDVTVQDCHKCLNDSVSMLPQMCPSEKEAVGWYDNCMLRYANRAILGINDQLPTLMLYNLINVTDNVNQFNQVLGNLLHKLQNKAASGDSQLKFATGSDKGDSFKNIYALAQCSPDLSHRNCFNCVGNFISNVLPSCCANSIGAQVLGPSCKIRYEDYLFYNIPASPPPQSGNGSNTLELAILIIVATVISVALAVGFIYLYRSKKSLEKCEMASPLLHQLENDESRSLEFLQFGFDTIRVATDDFSDGNKLGHGGFGTVYKGILTNGQEIAVKRLSKDSGQGDGEFKTEVFLMTKLQHKNLVRFLGFCLEEEERLLIYEFVRNASLDQFLFDVSKRSYLNWQIRHQIIMGIARGLLYLHEDSQVRVIHRDLKPSNILLDADMNPKIADFGMARLFGVDQTSEDTSKIVGTYGYMAPEYALHGIFSVGSDVYSFGILVLEIITGRKSNGFHNEGYREDLISFVWRNWREDMALNVIDPSLSTGSRIEIIRCIHMSLLCVQESIEDRPTMSSVVLMLSSHSLTLPKPSYPPFGTDASMDTNSDHPEWGRI